MSLAGDKGQLVCTYKKKRMKVRGALAVFALTNFLLGMGTFMFIFCSSSPKHIRNLHSLLTNRLYLVKEGLKQTDSPN